MPPRLDYEEFKQQHRTIGARPESKAFEISMDEQDPKMAKVAMRTANSVSKSVNSSVIKTEKLSPEPIVTRGFAFYKKRFK